ncbi:MAG TPA: dihydropteroate synthase [Patescibacteria group bacterium]|jgi:dihydropteroate synthase
MPRSVDLETKTELVGILNLTPDSFSDGGRYEDARAAVEHVERLFAEGAALVDVGAESTRPGAEPLSAQAEWERLASVLPYLLDKYPGRISLDTYHPETVQRAFELAPVVVNDVTGLRDPYMAEVVAALDATCVVSHLPEGGIQAAHRAKSAATAEEVRDDLLRQVKELVGRGVDAEHLILDPGIGFGKPPELNRELLGFAALVPDFPVMVGYSRKRFLGDDHLALAPNLEAARTAVEFGARYLRVHDVAGHAPLL